MSDQDTLPFRYPTATGERKCPSCGLKVEPPGGEAHVCSKEETKRMEPTASNCVCEPGRDRHYLNCPARPKDPLEDILPDEPTPLLEDAVKDPKRDPIQRCFCGSQFFASSTLSRMGRGGPRLVPWDVYTCIQCSRAHVWHHKSGRLFPVESKSAGLLLADELG